MYGDSRYQTVCAVKTNTYIKVIISVKTSYIFVCLAWCNKMSIIVLSHVITNNKSPPKHFELDSASCRAAKVLSEGTNQVSLGQLLTAQ